MAKLKTVRGRRANKPNDSFGTINNDTLYRGKYKEDVYKEDEEVTQEAQEETPVQQEQTDPSFVDGKEKADHDYKKRYDDLKRHYDAKVNEFKEKEKELEATLSSATREQNISLPKTAEELQKFKDEYPDVYDVIDTIASQKSKQESMTLQKELEEIQEKEKETRVQAAYSELLNKHSDFNDLRQSDEFLQWLDDQPENISDGILKNNTDAHWASRVIDLYKIDQGISTKKLKNTTAANIVKSPKAKEVGSSDKRVWKVSEIGKLKPWEFEKLEKEIDQARSEGRVDFNN